MGDDYIYSALYYVIFSFPGLILLFVIWQFNFLSGFARDITISVIAAIFFTPAFVTTHVVFVMPMYFVFILGGREFLNLAWVIGGPLIVFAGTFLIRRLMKVRASAEPGFPLSRE